MEASVAAFPAATSDQVASRTAFLPWYGLAMIVAATSVTFGVLWDISWHTVIGRDTFWTPAHLAIYLGGILAGCSCGFLILKTTFAGSAEARGASVKVWGMRGPYGAWLACWGAFAMITSAPFDNWWHNAYGLDVQILSPPHTVLAVGILSIAFSGLMIALAEQNRSGTSTKAIRIMYVYLAGIMVTNMAIFVSEYTYPNLQHGSAFYLITSLVFPFFLVSFGRAGKVRYPVTAVAASYMAIILGVSWFLEQFPASPKLAPIYMHLTHLAPFGFPLLLVVPAFAIDWILRRFEGRSDWLTALPIAVAFFALTLATQWYFSKLLLSPAGDNGFLMGNQIWAYSNHPGPWQYEYWDWRDNPFTWMTAVWSIAIGYVSARLGLLRGNWLRQVVR